MIIKYINAAKEKGYLRYVTYNIMNYNETHLIHHVYFTLNNLRFEPFEILVTHIVHFTDKG